MSGASSPAISAHVQRARQRGPGARRRERHRLVRHRPAQGVRHVTDEALDVLAHARRAAQASHSSTSTRRCRIVTRLTSAERQGAHQRAVLQAIARGDDPRPARQTCARRAAAPAGASRTPSGRPARTPAARRETGRTVGRLGQEQPRRAEHRAARRRSRARRSRPPARSACRAATGTAGPLRPRPDRQCPTCPRRAATSKRKLCSCAMRWISSWPGAA